MVSIGVKLSLWRKKDLLHRNLTKGNKVTLQLVVPEIFYEKVLRLAHETLMAEHLGIKKKWAELYLSFLARSL